MNEIFQPTMKRTCISFAFLFCTVAAFGQAGDFRSIGSGLWGTPATWERDADLNGTFEESPSTVAPNTPLTAGTIEIRNTHIVTVGANVTVDQTFVRSGGELAVNNGVILTLGAVGGVDEITVDAGGILTVIGSINFGGSFPLRTVLVNGSLRNSGSLTGASSSKLTFGSLSNYFHLFTDGGIIPLASWSPTSTVNITGMGSGAGTAPTGLNQTFGNFVWNTPAFDNFIDLGGLPTTINGDFRVEDTGAGSFVYNFGSGVNTTLTIGGDLSISGGAFAFTALIGAPGTLNINNSLTAGKGFKVTGGFIQVADDDNVTVNCSGVFELSNGDVELAATTGFTTLNVSGNFTHTSGNLFSSTTNSNLNFNGTSTQVLTSTIVPAGTINYTVPLNATLSIPGNNFISGSGTFTLSGTLEVGSTNANGAIQTGSSAGNIRVIGTRTYNSGCTVVYNGTGGQFIGNGHPSTPGVNTTINNTSGVSLIVGTPFIITTNLTLLSGNLNVGNGAFTLDGSLTAGGNNVTIGSGGSITINGSSVVGTFPFPAGNQTFTNLTLNNSNGMTLANNVTLTGTLTLSLGDLVFNNQTLTLNGSLASSSGFLSSNNSSSLIIGGTGALGTLAFSGSGNSLGTLTINRASSGSVGLNSNLTINTALNLTNGAFNNISGLAMANGTTIFRTSNGSLTGNRPVSSGTYNVTYNTSSTVTTGNELPTSLTENVLGNVTINGPVSLSQNVTVNGTVLLQSSTFSLNALTLKMRGSSWSKAGGAMNPAGGGQVTFDGNTTISTTSGNPIFPSIRVESGRTLTFPAATVEVEGNITFLAGSTINPSGGTILLNGSGAQNIGGGGATLANVSVNKAGGSVSLTNALNMTGLLLISSATSFASDGNLTLISTSDGPSGNASIGELAAGASVTGDVIVQRFMSGEGRIWRYLSSPIQNASVASWKDDFPITGSFTDPSTAAEWPGLTPPVNPTGLSFFRYNETVAGALDLGWENYPSSGLASANPLEVGRGYSAFVRISASPTVVDVTGPINSGDQVLPVSFTGSAPSGDNGWNLVGNPYPSTIDWDDASWTKTSIGGTIQIRDNAMGIFQTWNGSVGSMLSGRIATGQAFWVKATAGSPSLVVREAAKTNGVTATFFKEDNQVPNAFEVTLAKGTLKDYTYIWFNEEATEEVDDQFDAIKFNNDIFDFSTQTLEGKKLAINTLPFSACDRQIKIDISTINSTFNLSGEYTMSFAQLGAIDPAIQFTLVDHFLGTSQPVTEGFQYTFTINKDDAATFGNARLELQMSELITDLQIEALGSQVCADATPTVTLPASQSGILYSVTKNGATLSEILAGNGSELVFNLPQELLSAGDNQLEIVANNGCSQQVLVQTPVVRKEIIEQVSGVEEASLCKGGSLTLKASGASASGAYRWYDSPTAATALFESAQNEFITPVLDKTKTFYVAIVNPLGCEGERVAAVAQVITFDDALITESDNTLSSNFATGNQWFKDGALIPGATSQSFKPEETGVYKVEVTIGTCTTSAERVFTVTGLEDEVFEGLMVAYPNPVKDELLLEVKGGIFAGNPRIVDLMGREIGTIDMKDEGKIVRGKFDFRGRASGIYLLQLSDRNGKLINKRIVKQ